MPFVTIKKAAPLDEIIDQIYAVEGQKGPQAAKQAKAALRQANPHLADLKTIPEGTVILIPEMEGLKPKPASEPLFPPAADFAQLSSALHIMGESLMAAHNKEVEEAKATVDRAKSKEFIKRINTEELKAAVAETVKNARARIKASKTLQGEIEKTLKHAGADLDDLQRRFGGVGTPPKAAT